MKNKLFAALILSVFAWQARIIAQPYNVTWIDQVGVSISSNTITATGSGWGNAGAASTNYLPAGEDGYVEATAIETNKNRFLGLSPSNANAHYTTITYGLLFNYLGQLKVLENGTNYGTLDTYVSGDVVRIERTGNTVYYKKNGNTFYTSTISSSGQLLVDISIGHIGGTLGEVQASFDPSGNTCCVNGSGGGNNGGGSGGGGVWGERVANNDIYYTDGKVAVGDTTALGILYVKNDSASMSGLVIDHTVGSNSTYGIQINVPNTTTKAFAIAQGGNTQLQISGDGKMFAREVEVTLNSFPDYVFAKDYDLIPLDALKTFIDKNHHLPNIPPAKEIDANGIGLGQLNILQMEKIEELTLYLLEMNERLNALEQENKELKEELENLKK